MTTKPALLRTHFGLGGRVGDGATAFLGVERSASGRRWRLRGIVDDGAAAAIVTQLAVPEIIARLLSQRGVGLEEAERFLTPRLRDQLPDPAQLKDMSQAVERLVRAIRDREKIVVFGDYDVDGATSAALLLRFLAAVGVEGGLYVPDRMREGYGPNAPALLRLKEQGARLVITVDCGTTAHHALEAAEAAGLDLIVIDHHVAEPLLPNAIAVVNPNRLDEESAHGHLAAVGVAFLLAVAANRALREAGWYRTRSEPDLLQWLDLVALGTVCDVVPLTGLNRALVAQGLKIAARGANPGMAALAALGASPGRASTTMDSYQLGFVLGPRVNAGGRVGVADLGARLLSTDDPELAAAWAQLLDGHNKERREIETQTLAAAIEQIERQNAESPVLVFAAAEGWHPGVIGIVAARLKERYGRPACVVALSDGIGKGSGRSVPGLALGPAVIAARQAGLVINGGGHAMAAGFTVTADRLIELQEFLASRLNDGLDRAILVPELAIDAALSAEAAQRGLLAQLDALAPFGSANPEPRFAFPMVRVSGVEAVGSGHLRLRVATALGSGNGAQLSAIAFRAADTPVGKLVAEAKGRAIHLAGHLRRDTWRGGDAIQLVVDDAASVLESAHG